MLKSIFVYFLLASHRYLQFNTEIYLILLYGYETSFDRKLLLSFSSSVFNCAFVQRGNDWCVVFENLELAENARNSNAFYISFKLYSLRRYYFKI